MFRFVWQKILNKKWLISCLLAGVVLLIAIACCNPMYTNAALQKTLTDQLEEQMVETNEYPAIAHIEGLFTDSKLANTSSKLFTDYKTGSSDLAALFEEKAVDTVTILETGQLKATLNVSRTGLNTITSQVNTMYGIEDNIEIAYGNMYTDNVESGVYEAIISESMLLNFGIVIGDTFTLNVTTEKGEPVQVKVVGVFRAKDSSDTYWVKDALDYKMEFFISEKNFDDVFMSKPLITSVTTNYYAVFDYRDIEIGEINSFIRTGNKIREDCSEGKLYKCEFNYEDSFETYRDGSNKVTITMWVFQIPVLILLCVFIFMVSNQIISIEQSEIAMLKSRGVSKKQLISSYLIQGSIISGVAMVIGIPLGYLFCVMFGATKSFMEFSIRTSISVKITWLSLLFALIAAILAIVFMTLPVLKYANFSIVEQKTNKKKSTKPLWQKVYLDFILFAISLYGFYSFNKQKDIIIKNINEGASIDPLLYFSSTVFILSIALIFLRVIPWIASVVYKSGAKKWKPASYAAFMQINKSIRKQSFIIVFLILTLALGIFNATTARSINDNEENRLMYNRGADIVMQETWKNNIAGVRDGYEAELEYTEPDFTVYNKLEGKVNQVTKVLIDDRVTVTGTGQMIADSTLFMAITTDEFGRTAYMPEGATKFHWYYYLNALAENPYGAIISRNYAKVNNLAVGDSFMVYRRDALDNVLDPINLTVEAIVDAWPGYENKVLGEGPDGKEAYLQQYLVVANFDTIQKLHGVEPYQIWISADDTGVVYDFAAENNLIYDTFIDSKQECNDVKEQPFFQVTSGMLTITFFVVLVLSMIGFLIYWITSIKSRELIFGIYRAMGLSMGEINTMLVLEHVFGSLLPIIIGIVIGIVGGKLFVPLIQLAYSPTYSTLETLVITSFRDMFYLGLCVIIMLVICFMIIRSLLKNMKIAQALKLGED